MSRWGLRTLRALLCLSIGATLACSAARRPMAATVEREAPGPLASSALAWHQIQDSTRSVAGQVLTVDSLTPLRAAQVGLLNTRDSLVASTVTSADGVFALHAPRAGRYRLVVRRIGFATATTILVVSDSLGVRVAGAMAPTVDRLMFDAASRHAGARRLSRSLLQAI